MTGRLIRRRMVVVFAGTLVASTAARSLTPTKHLADELDAFDLAAALPAQFGSWSMETNQVAPIVNPQQEQIIEEIYSQVLSRSYVHEDGYRIMVAIAYGRDQREALQVHYPEVCYTMQGFTVLTSSRATVSTIGGPIPVMQLDTTQGVMRPEPLTYWLVVGDSAVAAGTGKKLAEMSYTLRGLIPDGLLFRVSSIDQNAKTAHKRQAEFIHDLAAAMRPNVRRRIIGA